MEDDFHDINKDHWGFEIQRGGFGSGTFEWTTDDPKNIYTDADGLHIVPTITTESTDITRDQLIDNHVLNLTVRSNINPRFPSSLTDYYSSRPMALAQQRALIIVAFEATKHLERSSILFVALVFLRKAKRRSNLEKLKS